MPISNQIGAIKVTLAAHAARLRQRFEELLRYRLPHPNLRGPLRDGVSDDRLQYAKGRADEARMHAMAQERENAERFGK